MKNKVFVLLWAVLFLIYNNIDIYSGLKYTKSTNKTTIKANGTEVTNTDEEPVTLDFSTDDFGLTETNGEVDLTLDSSVTKDDEWNTIEKIEAVVGKDIFTKDEELSGDLIEEGSIDESKLNISNDPVDGYYLQFDAANGMTWVPTSGSGGVSYFKNLLDTPNDYSGQALKYLRVNSSEDAVEFAMFPTHNELSNLQGGATGEYYHLTYSNYDKVVNKLTVDDTDKNVFLGTSVFANDAGKDNLGIGYQAGYYNLYSSSPLTGHGNLYIGYRAGYGDTGGNKGNFNIAIGFDSFFYNSTGSSNVAIGKSSLSHCNSANENVAIGYSSLTNLQTGGNNIAFGSNSGFYLQDGVGNILIGRGTGTGASGSEYDRNTYIGYYSGYDTTTGSDNICIGYMTGYSITTGSNNILIGNNLDVPSSTTSNYMSIGDLLYGDLSNNRVGINKSSPSYTLDVNGTINGTSVKVNGTDVLTSETDPNFSAMDTETELESHLTDVTNVYTNNDGSLADDDLSDNSINDLTDVDTTGWSEGKILKFDSSGNLTVGEDNSGVTNHNDLSGIQGGATGEYYHITQAVYDNVTNKLTIDDTNKNVFLGTSVFAHDSGDYNVGIGYMAGYNNDTTNSTGTYNVYIGYKAGYGATVGSYNNGKYNVGIGYVPLYYNTTGMSNIAIGAYACFKNLSASGNIGICDNALYSNTTGVHNIAIGQYSGYYLNGGSYNIMLGEFTGYGSSGSNYSDNIFIGDDSGKNATTGSTNIFIGHSTGDNVTEGDHNILIGHYIDLPTSVTNYYMNIGDLLIGDLNNKKLGIGTSGLPVETLEVNGGIKIGTSTNTNTGTIRWTGTDFEGYDGSSWRSFTTNTAEDITMEAISGSTYDTVQDWANITQSAGKISGGTLTDNGDGSLSVSAGTGFIRVANNDTSTIKHFSWATNSSVALTDNATNYIYVEYNGGNPQVVASTSIPSDKNTNVMLGLVYREGTDLHIVTAGQVVSNFAKNVIWKDIEINGKFQRQSGIIISETGTRNFAITSGYVYAGLTKVSLPTFDSSGTDTFTYYYRDGSGGWTKVTGQTQIDNTHYDDGSGTLATLSDGSWWGGKNYGVHWVYEDIDGDVFVVYGQGDYTLAEAQDAQPPTTIPTLLEDCGGLIGKIVIQKDASSFTTCQSAFTTIFTPSIVQNHNDLGNIQGGDTGEYYHLTETEHSAVQTSQINMIYISGMEYVDSDTIKIKAGTYGMCNGHYFKVTSDTTVDISSPAGEDFYYLYIDDDASSYPTPSFYFSTTEPTHTADISAGKIGWYNGDDRCIGSVWVDSSNAITNFVAVCEGSTIGYYPSDQVCLGSGMNPNGSWQAPTTESSVYCPVNAIKLLVLTDEKDAGNTCSISVANYEQTQSYHTSLFFAQTYRIFGYDHVQYINEVPLGSSRNIRFAGEDNDDNTTGVYVCGWTYSLK